jgi:SAM-dependent methyltransferase
MDEQLVEQVRTRYADAARAVLVGTVADGTASCATDGSCCGDSNACCTPATSTLVTEGGARFYTADDAAQLPAPALLASLGCGNPMMVADLRPGERVLDLGSGGGIDVLLSARRVGPTGFAYGVDMTPEMLELARRNAAAAGATNVEFLEGRIEAVPLPDASVDVVISNCVINLSTDKPAVLAEMARVLVPGGRLGIADIVAEDRLAPADRAALGDHAGCIAGALSATEYLDGLATAGFVDAEVQFLDDAATGLHSAFVRAVKPA